MDIFKLQGSLEFLKHVTTIDNPFLVYNAHTDDDMQSMVQKSKFITPLPPSVLRHRFGKVLRKVYTSTRAGCLAWWGGWGCSLCSGLHVVCIEVSRFETVDGNSICMTIDVDSEVLIGSFDDWVWSIIWWLKWFADSSTSDKHVCGSGQTISNVAVLLCKSGWRRTNGLHMGSEVGDIVRWVRQRSCLRRGEESPGRRKVVPYTISQSLMQCLL